MVRSLSPSGQPHAWLVGWISMTPPMFACCELWHRRLLGTLYVGLVRLFFWPHPIQVSRIMLNRFMLAIMLWLAHACAAVPYGWFLLLKTHSPWMGLPLGIFQWQNDVLNVCLFPIVNIFWIWINYNCCFEFPQGASQCVTLIHMRFETRQRLSRV